MQRYRAVILIVVFGVLPVVVIFFVALSYLRGQEQEAALQPATAVVETPPPAPPPPEPTRVLAAARDLPVGVLIRDTDVTETAIAPEAVRGGHLLIDEGEGAAANGLRGHAVRKPVAAGEAITRSALIAPWEQGFLAAVLKPGARAVTIRVDPATSHAGLLDPGDRVDVILTAELSITERERAVFTRTIVEDVRVVAADRRFGEEFGFPPGSEGETGNASASGARTEMVTATLEVSPGQADRLVIAEHEGRLSLALRSLAATAEPRTTHSALRLQEVLLPQSEALLPQSEDSPGQAEEPVAPVATTVRIYRGNRPVETVVFDNGSAPATAGTSSPVQSADTSLRPAGSHGSSVSADGLMTASEGSRQ